MWNRKLLTAHILVRPEINVKSTTAGASSLNLGESTQPQTSPLEGVIPNYSVHIQNQTSQPIIPGLTSHYNIGQTPLHQREGGRKKGVGGEKGGGKDKWLKITRQISGKEKFSVIYLRSTELSFFFFFFKSTQQTG